MYSPQQTDDGPDVAKLTTWRQTMVKPTSGNRGYRIDDDWTTKRKATLDIEWTGSTNFEENTAYKDEFITDEPEEQQEAKRATGVPTPQQPTEQERREHELTHTFPTEAGVQRAYKAKEDRTTTQSKQAKHQ